MCNHCTTIQIKNGCKGGENMINFENDEQILQELDVYCKEDHNGIKCGIPNLDEIVRLDKKRFTIVTSNENQGKTTFLNFYCYQMAKTNHFKTLFLSFENDKMLFYNKLKKVYKGNEFVKYSRFLDYNGFTSIDDIFNAINEYKEIWGFDILIIDPFESLQMFMGGNYKSEDYAVVLERMRQFGKNANIITILCAHQRKLEDNEEPSINKIFGSVSFGNKADNVISIQQVKPFITKVKALKIRHNFTEGLKGDSVYFKFDEESEHFTPIDEKEINDFDFAEYVLNNTMEVQKEVFEMVASKAENDHLFEPQQPINKGIDTNKAEEQKELESENKAFLEQTKVSVYDRFEYVQDVTLKDALEMGKDHQRDIEKAREMKQSGDLEGYKAEKRKLPSFTTTATYKGERKAENLTKYNALCVIDLDDIEDVEKAKADIKQLPFILYAAKSVGGKGLFCIVRLDGSKDEYIKHWYAIKDEFQTIGYKVDESCKDVSRLRFVSYDENPYINYQASIYTAKKEIQTTTPPTFSLRNETHPKGKGLTPREQIIFDSIITDVQSNHIQLSKNHADTLYIARVLSSLMGEDGRQYLHVIRQQRNGYNERKIDDLYDSTLANCTERYTMGALRKKYNDAIKENNKK